ncbi:unnamed protein product [Soboliphyme baturini]|uniref:WW domain-containing protein n=1 Tax=Soboliphyme baturini TaxID=241478 RepID=A0A183IRW1_9BILA|nr:unnamed protein product [Soboliphyme baturini]
MNQLVKFSFNWSFYILEPWILSWSGTKQKLYYFNPHTGVSLFDPPPDVFADFQETYSTRHAWFLNRKSYDDKHSLLDVLKNLRKMLRHREK